MKRFHDNFGKFVGFSRLPFGVRSFYQAIRRKLFEQYPDLPWIPFTAIEALNNLCEKQWSVIEIGGGMSTLWFAERCAHVVTIEASETWYPKLRELLASRAVHNVDLRHEPDGNRMCDFARVPDLSVDLLFIDGGPRERCLKNGFAKVRPSGWLYLDNWDVPAFWLGSSEFLETHASEIASLTQFTDYVPGSFCVNTGLLVQKA